MESTKLLRRFRDTRKVTRNGSQFILRRLTSHVIASMGQREELKSSISTESLMRLKAHFSMPARLLTRSDLLNETGGNTCQ